MQLFDAIAKVMPLFVPLEDERGVYFAQWEPGATPLQSVALNASDFAPRKTALSPKGFFLPMVEHLYSSHFSQTKHGGTWQITPAATPNAPFAVLGVRSCDAAGLELLDEVFLAESIDIPYQARRTAAHIITVPCTKRCATCFCDVFGIDPTQPGGDVTLHFDNDTQRMPDDPNRQITDDMLRLQAHTPKGEALLKIQANKLIHSTENQILQTDSSSSESIGENHFNEAANNSTKTFHPPVNQKAASILADFEARFFGGDNPVITGTDATALFHSPAWDTLYLTCVACGTCAFLCPTCQCYDINNETAHCHRHWDTCLNASFTQMAHGNPRPTKKERFRQRFMHKLVYFRQRYGALASNQYSCVGCGRCVEFCPAGINPVDVARELYAVHAATSPSEATHV
ncbi:MAG: 4Fe-4S dicluster domain-containing protein [Defluviitaleaceae bacterium]|nr:4Fe-4S dicluster domain-containing protein [Defluviitaleaceae bacterium]